MRAGGREPQQPVALTHGAQVLGEAAFVGVVVAGVSQTGVFGTVGYGLIVRREDFLQPRYVGFSLAAYVVGGYFELCFESVEEGVVAAFLLEQLVALLEGVVVAEQGVEVRCVALRYYLVDKASALCRLAAHEAHVGRREQHQREGAYVLGKPFVGLAGALEALPVSRLHGGCHFLVESSARVAAAQHGETFATPHEHAVLGACEALAEA